MTGRNRCGGLWKPSRANTMNYKATKHFWQRARERGLLKRHADIAEAIERGRKIPQRNNTGAVIANTFAHIGEQITVIRS